MPTVFSSCESTGEIMWRIEFSFCSSEKFLVWYSGVSRGLSGFTQICKKWTGSDRFWLYSEWVMPVPTTVSCRSPRFKISTLPIAIWLYHVITVGQHNNDNNNEEIFNYNNKYLQSRCSNSPLMMYENISYSLCGCVPNPVLGWTISSFRTRNLPNPSYRLS